MGQDGMVSQQPVGQFPINGGQVIKQQVLMVIHELFLEGAIEAFGVGVHFRGPRIRPPMGDVAGVESIRGVPAGGGGGAGARGQGLWVSASLSEPAFPAIERAAAHAKGLTRGGHTMAGEELQNLESVVDIVGYHLPTMPDLH